MKNFIDQIKDRKSCRTFSDIEVSKSKVIILKNFINNNYQGLDKIPLDLKIVLPDPKKRLKLNYGTIKGEYFFLLGSVNDSQSARVNYGMVMEKILLHAAKLQIASCWIGYFNRSYFSQLPIISGSEIPAIVVLGYQSEKKAVSEKISRLVVGGDKRKSWEELFFDFHSQKPLKKEDQFDYHLPLEMVRLAPSSGNTQPWRIYKDEANKRYHFFKKVTNKTYEKKGLHDVDLGIAMCHFQLTVVNQGLKGDWIRLDQMKNIGELQYIFSWKY